MTKKRLLAFLGWIVTALILAIGIKLITPSPVAAQTNPTVLVSAAASLKESLEEIAPVYRQANSNVTIRYNFGASGALQQQIENGAPADIFISAANKQMDALQQKNLLLQGTRRNLLTNRVVLIVPKNSTVIANFRGLTATNVRRIAIGEPRTVPAGQYAEEILRNLGILEQVRPKFVLGNSVRNVLAAVESGNADAGVVYATDARLSDRVRVVETAAQNLHSPVVYPMAVLSASRNAAAAREYTQFLASDRRASSIFEKYGFTMAR
ncbi:molybdate ABC transporter substrate-binding protein [Microseira sp. BLCC-F43]|jgi:molybdate transport system substrate-binding protein|uniref:molybdate ABC transporter substrate-binding protein n=1 Tax=Microseira sp. BLCC-F43 TaxID=3153602 RepID=UPI0035BB7D4D